MEVDRRLRDATWEERRARICRGSKSNAKLIHDSGVLTSSQASVAMWRWSRETIDKKAASCIIVCVWTEGMGRLLWIKAGWGGGGGGAAIMSDAPRGTSALWGCASPARTAYRPAAQTQPRSAWPPRRRTWWPTGSAARSGTQRISRKDCEKTNKWINEIF